MSSGTPSSQVLSRWIAPSRIEHAAGAERPRPGGPQPPDAGDVAGVRLAADDEDVDVGALHLGEDALAPGGAQRGVVGDDLGARR